MRRSPYSRAALALAGGALGASACATSTLPLTTDNGLESYKVYCDNQRSCERRAAQLCPSGYDVFEPDSLTRAVYALAIPMGGVMRGFRDLALLREPDGDETLFFNCTPEGAAENAASDEAPLEDVADERQAAAGEDEI